MGVTEIEMTNWTKTREPNEIGDGEKKLNSYSELAGLNENILETDVESISDLYDTNTGKLREIINLSNNLQYTDSLENTNKTISDMNTDANDNISKDITGENTVVIGNKVLRTPTKLSNINIIDYTIKALYGYLKSDNDVGSNNYINWDEQNRVTWKLYTRDDPNGKVNSIEWRMLSAKVNITREQKKLIDDKKVFALLGIVVDDETGFELIMPCDDVVSVFVNDGNTNINYHNRQGSSVIYKLNDVQVKFKSMIGTENECINSVYHEELSSHTDGYHVDMGNLINPKVVSDSGSTASYSKREIMELDLGGNLNIGENEIDILVGNYIVDSSYKNKLCGFSKLNLYIIEKPKVDVEMMFYKYKDGKAVFFDTDYRPTKGEEVFIRFDITNKSEIYDLKNISFERLLSDSNKKTNINFVINENSVSYGGKDITDGLRCYLDGDFSKKYNIDALKILNAGQTITLMSDDFVYSITDEEAKNGQIFSYANVSGSYMNNKLKFISDEKTLMVYANKDFGVLKIKCSIENANNEVDDLQNIYEEKSQDMTNLLVNVNSDKDFANLYVEPGQTYTLNNLNITDCYYINLIVPQDYEVVNSDTYFSQIENKVCLNQSQNNGYTKNIEIKLKKKNNAYFYKNKQIGVKVNIE